LRREEEDVKREQMAQRMAGCGQADALEKILDECAKLLSK